MYLTHLMRCSDMDKAVEFYNQMAGTASNSSASPDHPKRSVTLLRFIMGRVVEYAFSHRGGRAATNPMFGGTARSRCGGTALGWWSLCKP